MIAIYSIHKVTVNIFLAGMLACYRFQLILYYDNQTDIGEKCAVM